MKIYQASTSDPSLRGLLAGVRPIYLSSFPAEQRVPWDDLTRSILGGHERLDVLELDDAVSGLAVTTYLPSVDVLYLEYLATNESIRNRGLGGRLFDHLVDGVEVRQGCRGIVLEVDRPDEGDPDESRLRSRRIEFYRRHGATLVTCAPGYRAPSLSGGPPLDMILMWHPCRSGVSALEGDLLRSVVTSILCDAYELARDDPLIAHNLRTLTC